MTALDRWAQAFWDVGEMEGGMMAEIPKGWGCVQWRSLATLLLTQRMTVGCLRVWVELAKEAFRADNRVHLTLETLAQRTQVSRGTVFRAVRFLEAHGALKRLSKKNENSYWMVNPLLGCKVMPSLPEVDYD